MTAIAEVKLILLKKQLVHDTTNSEMLKRHGSEEGDDDEVGDIVELSLTVSHKSFRLLSREERGIRMLLLKV